MKTSCGMPGPDGSIGECCYCGDSFLAAILGVDSFSAVEVEIDGCANALFVHKKCLPRLKACAEFKDLPEKSMLRKAWERHNATIGGAK